jgi:hypothetical protein
MQAQNATEQGNLAPWGFVLQTATKTQNDAIKLKKSLAGVLKTLFVLAVRNVAIKL